MVWRIRVTINLNMNSKLAGTTMSKISFEGVVALKRAGLVSMFPTVYSASLQEQIFHLPQTIVFAKKLF